MPSSEIFTRLDYLGVQSRSSAAALIDLVGVYSGIKPTTFISFRVAKLSPKRRKYLENKFLQDLQDLGLYVIPSISVKSRHKHYEYTISKSQNNAQKLQDILKSHDGYLSGSDQTQREIGELLGYPKTATEYFIKRLKEGNPAPIIRSHPSQYFGQIINSPDNVEEELKTYSIPMMDAALKYLPKTSELKREPTP